MRTSGWHFCIRDFLLLCLMALWTVQALAAAPVVEVQQADVQALSLTEFFSYLEDPSGDLTLANVQQAEVAARFTSNPATTAALSFGFTRSAYWLRLVLRNTSEQSSDRWLEVANAQLSHVALHQPDASGTDHAVVTGRALPFASRPYPNRFFVFPITVAAQSEQVVYLRIQSNAILVPARLWTPQAFHAYERDDYSAQVWYFGMASAMVLFNLLLFVSLRERIYLLYVGFVGCFALTLATQNGLAHEFLWPGATLWSDISYYVGTSFSIVALLMFMRSMLETRALTPLLDRLLVLLVVVFLLTPVGLVVSFKDFAKAATALDGAAALLIIGVSLFCALKRQRSAYFFVAAYFMLAMGGMLNVMRYLAWVPSNFLTINGTQVGSALEMLLLAFALADRFNVLRSEKARAQREALVTEQTLVESLRSAERVLEQRVAQRTQDLTLANQAYHSVLDNAQDVIVLTDAQGRISNWNRQGMVTFGWTLQLALGKEITTLLFAPHIQPDIAAAMARSQGVQQATPRMETMALRRDGSECPIELSLTSVEVGDQLECSFFIRDISQRRKAELQISESLAKQLELADLKSRFVSMASHEFRTPLAVILSSSDLIRHYGARMDEQERLASFDSIDHSVRRMKDLLEDVLLIGKSDAGVSQFKPVTMALRPLCESIVAEVKVAFAQLSVAAHAIELHIDDVQCEADLDERWFRHIFGNLLSNALKYSPEGGSVSFSVTSRADVVELSVTDCGIGLPPEDISRLFESFFRASNSGNIAGTGLGLSIVKRAVELHGGRISVASDLGRGTTFKVVLPRQRAIN
jgi:PAS domain S-box-containing protein